MQALAEYFGGSHAAVISSIIIVVRDPLFQALSDEIENNRLVRPDSHPEPSESFPRTRQVRLRAQRQTDTIVNRSKTLDASGVRVRFFEYAKRALGFVSKSPSLLRVDYCTVVCAINQHVGQVLAGPLEPLGAVYTFLGLTVEPASTDACSTKVERGRHPLHLPTLSKEVLSDFAADLHFQHSASVTWPEPIQTGECGMAGRASLIPSLHLQKSQISNAPQFTFEPPGKEASNKDLVHEELADANFRAVVASLSGLIPVELSWRIYLKSVTPSMASIFVLW
jgi:hypothetical protein